MTGGTGKSMGVECALCSRFKYFKRATFHSCKAQGKSWEFDLDDVSDDDHSALKGGGQPDEIFPTPGRKRLHTASQALI